MKSRTFNVSILPAALLLLPVVVQAQANNGRHSRALISDRIDETRLVAIHGNTRSAANAANDLGRVADNLSLDHLLLQLQRPPEQEQALNQFIDQLHDPNSANFHKWLTAAQFGQQFGLASQDLETITGWLQSHGFTVNQIYPNGTLIDFSGTAGQVREAFRTELHRLNVDGTEHIANMSDPQIPAALAPAIAGVVSLHDFRPRPLSKPRQQFTYTSSNGTFEAVVPADLATIYNLNPLFSAGISGAGQTIVVIENTNVYSTDDWNNFRAKLGLSGFSSGSFTQVHPGNNCLNPGVVPGNDGEATLDAEWASAAAPNAAIELASCRDTRTTFGGLLALQNLLNASTHPPSIVSISYGECEAENGASANASYNAAYQQAVSEGVSVFVSSGDEGAASCDAGAANATHGIGVSAFASTPNNVAVGGTDFGDAYAGSVSNYWNPTNSAAFGSAKSYIPEIPWNDSCASILIANTLGYATTYGPNGFCNSSTGRSSFLMTTSGSGGPSGCATGTASITGVVSGTCKGYPKPSWQSGVIGLPSDGVRDLPDVSLFAANGVWGHYYVYCFSDPANGGASCAGDPSTWAGAGGTSFSAPIMAGIQALVNQKQRAPQGNPNYVYYKLAAAEFGSNGNAACNSSNGSGTASTCMFYDVTLGDMDVNCSGTHSCFGTSTTGNGFRRTTIYGALSASSTSYAPAFGATTGWDFATGIGTVNAANLVNNWTTAAGSVTSSH